MLRGSQGENSLQVWNEALPDDAFDAIRRRSQRVCLASLAVAGIHLFHDGRAFPNPLARPGGLRHRRARELVDDAALGGVGGQPQWAIGHLANTFGWSPVVFWP